MSSQIIRFGSLTGILLLVFAFPMRADPPKPFPRAVPQLERDPEVVQAMEVQTPELPSDQVPGVQPQPTPAAEPPKVTPSPPSLTDGKDGQATGGDGKEKDRKGSPVAGWRDGFFLQSDDKAFVLRVTGQIQADYREFLRGPDNVDIDTFLVRRARLGIEATMFNYYEFRLLPDFGQGRAQVQDAYLNIHYWDEFQVQFGKFKQPFSYEQLIQDRYVPTMERSLFDQLVPARDAGVMIHGQKLFGDRLDYAVSISNGEINGDFDLNDYKDYAARVAVRPFNSPELWPAVRLLQVGISGTTGVEQEPMFPTTLRTPGTVRWFVFNPTVRADGLRNRWSPELSYFYGPLGFAAQYFRMDQEMRPRLTGAGSDTVVDVPFEGYYVMATYLLTGETRTGYSQAIDPLNPFDPRCHCHAPGAWELVARVSRLDVGDVVFTPGPTQLANPALFSSGVTELTLGFNWYLNKWVRMQFNWEHAWFDEPVQLGRGEPLKRQDTLLTRFQIIF